MEPCKALNPVTSPDINLFKKIAGTWVSDYAICQFKQAVVVDCFNATQKSQTSTKDDGVKSDKPKHTQW